MQGTVDGVSKVMLASTQQVVKLSRQRGAASSVSALLLVRLLSRCYALLRLLESLLLLARLHRKHSERSRPALLTKDFMLAHAQRWGSLLFLTKRKQLQFLEHLTRRFVRLIDTTLSC